MKKRSAGVPNSDPLRHDGRQQKGVRDGWGFPPALSFQPNPKRPDPEGSRVTCARCPLSISCQRLAS